MKRIELDSEDAEEMTDDEYYATFTDEQLLELSRKEVAEIDDVNLLERIAKLNRSLR